ncbi:MAG TPA: universal stress protein [Polyangiaceae bacterium]|jgi:nucleotide-binding universal stress UspA family protein
MHAVIVVGTDLGPDSEDAIREADRRARRDGARLIVAHATSPLLWVSSDETLESERARTRIEQQMQLMCGRTPTEYEIVIERGFAHTVLTSLAAARQALLVVGSHLEHGFSHALLRDVTERVVTHALGPVLVARPRTGSGQILVAIDRPFYLSAGLALPLVLEESKRSSAEITALHCLNAGFIETITTDLINGGVYAKAPLGQRSQLIESYRALARELDRNRVSAAIKVVHGTPEEWIPRIARDIGAELIVLGPTRHPAASQVERAIASSAPCSVLFLDPKRAQTSARWPQLSQRAVERSIGAPPHK